GALRLGTGVGGFVLGFAAMQAANVEGVVAAVMAMFGGAMGAAIIGARPRTLVPIDAQPLPAWPRIGLGRIVEAGAIEAPGSRLRCAAWAVELTYDGSWGTRTTLRAGASAGFDVVLDGGERVRIPPGPLWLAGPLLQVDG